MHVSFVYKKLLQVIKRSNVYRLDLESRNLSKNKMAAALVNSITLFCLYPVKTSLVNIIHATCANETYHDPPSRI